MATIGKNFLTLKDMYSQMEGDGKVTAAIIDLFVSSNAILEDAIAVECNQGTSHYRKKRFTTTSIQTVLSGG